MGNATEYNYARFDEYVTSGPEAAEFGAFRTHLGVGGSAPDASLTRLADGAPVALSDLWRSEPLVIEFGSFT